MRGLVSRVVESEEVNDFQFYEILNSDDVI